MGQDKSSNIKSAYERALERLEQQGIDRPKEDALTDDTREQMAEVRRWAESKIAELEILHRQRLAKLTTSAEREEERQDFRRDRLRIESERDRKLEKLRGGR